MRKIKVSLDDLLVVLESMRDTAGTTEIIFFEYNGKPAICDADDRDNVISFATESDNEENEEITH